MSLEPDDQETLVARAREGDRAAFGELVRLYERRVIALLLSTCPGHDVAEELAQETFVRAFLALKKLKNPKEFGSWLFGIARNSWREWAKDRHRRKKTPEPPVHEKTELVKRRAVLNQQIFHIVQGLPAPYNEVLSMRYFSGSSCQEISEFLGRPLGTVTKQISRAHALVAQELKALRGFTTLLHFMLPKGSPDGD